MSGQSELHVLWVAFAKFVDIIEKTDMWKKWSGMHGVARAKIFFLLLMGLVSLAAAESEVDNSYFVKAWTVADGLPDNKVVGVAQSSDGYLWVATHSGLARFDGVRFQLFKAANTVGNGSSTMRALYKNRHGDLWLAKETALIHIDVTSVETFTQKDGFPNSEEQISLAEERDGSLWISYKDGKVVCFKGGNLKFFSATDGLPTNGVCQLCINTKGEVWFSKNEQVGIFRDGKFITLLNLSQRSAVIAPTRTKGIWVCEDHQLSKFSEDSGLVEVAKLPVSTKHLLPTAIFED